MRVTTLKLANLRAIRAAEFRFRRGINLLVGVNGVGKSTVLDALAVCLSAIVKRANRMRAGGAKGFGPDDVRLGANASNVECAVQIGSAEHRYLIHRPQETSTPQSDKQGLPREQVHDTPARTSFLGQPPAVAKGTEETGRPLAILFSTARAVPSQRAPRRSVAAGGIGAAFGGALVGRELRLGELAAWMRAQKALQSERPSAGRALKAFEDAVSRFLPEYRNLRADGNGLLVDRQNGTVAVRQMSDGERGILALVLDLARRLFQANPEMHDPISEAEVVVLIDEIDLHLHPSWQRRIVGRLTDTFPRCQFIATTHSPQVIGEVKHDRIHIMAGDGAYSPTHSFGVDSSRVLEEIMSSESRNPDVQKRLSEVSADIAGERYDDARMRLDALLNEVGRNAPGPEAVRLATLLDFLEGNE